MKIHLWHKLSLSVSTEGHIHCRVKLMDMVFKRAKNLHRSDVFSGRTVWSQMHHSEGSWWRMDSCFRRVQNHSYKSFHPSLLGHPWNQQCATGGAGKFVLKGQNHAMIEIFGTAFVSALWIWGIQAKQKWAHFLLRLMSKMSHGLPSPVALSINHLSRH